MVRDGAADRGRLFTPLHPDCVSLVVTWRAGF